MWLKFEGLEVLSLDVKIAENGDGDGQAPDDEIWQRQEGDSHLGQFAPAGATWPEEKTRSAAKVCFRDKAELAAISAHGMVISHDKVHSFRDSQSKFLDKF